MGKIIKHYKKILIILVLLLIAISVFSLFIPFERDEGGYAYIGSLWLEGKGIPYLSVFDPKTPIPYILFGLGNALISHTILGIRLVAVLYKTCIILTVYFIAKSVTKIKIAVPITILASFYLLSLQLEGNGFNTEIHMLLPLLLFVLFIIHISKRKKNSLQLALCAGICAGVAFLGKTVVLFAIASIFLWFVCYKKSILSSVGILLGAVIPLFGFGLYFWSKQALLYAYKYVYLYNRIYVKEGFTHSQLFTQGHFSILGAISWLTFIPDVISPLLILVVFGLFMTIHKRNLSWWISILLVMGTWFGVKFGFRIFPHYFIPFAVALCIACIPLFEVLSEKKYQKIFFVLFIFLIFIVFIPEIPIYAKGSYGVLYQEYGGQADWFTDARGVSNWIRENKKPQQTLLIWANEPEIYYYSNILSTTRYINMYEFWYFPNDQKNWNGGILKKQPTYIITYANDPPSFSEAQLFFDKIKAYKKIKTIGTYYIFKHI